MPNLSTRLVSAVFGQCGLSRRSIRGADLIEVGYLFNRAYWRQGYAVEAQTCRISRLLSTGRPPRPLHSDLFHLL
ncbi:GNAT family N-acetyltransferase [Leucobacter sp. G161]|uniref:GNAT family N-acetyltransferase n=1 Tax=Leucobacter sp. G161 TaxID=663704 RepID=UPI0026F4454F|nr:GNAT family N-acetyltransferase [Leucobacter sp. G161]